MEALTLEALMRSWIAGPLPDSYRETVDAVLTGLKADASHEQSVEACAQLAMLFGDSGAPELCVVVSYRGLALAESLADDKNDVFTTRFLSHAFLAMADLGLARSADAEAKALPYALTVDETAAAAWIREFLAPLGGSLEAGTQFASRLAAIRAGVLPVPDPLTVDAVSRLPTR
ncbi:MAG: hypothetical protein AB8I08_31505 [Sandaracinaceae bacterium]